MRSLSIAATGMNAQQTNVEVIANNIANINTTGYKRMRAEFTDLLYQAERVAGTPNRGGQETIPEGAQVGLGVRTAAVRNLHAQGSLIQTGNQFDVAINGRGYFQVQGANGELFYTRAGAFNKSATGQIVTLEGYLVQPNITVPDNATEVQINEDGRVFATIDGQAAQQELGQLTLANFVNDVGLEPMGDNLYRETLASGAAQVGVAGDIGFGKVHQKYLEASNVDPVKEITELIAAQRGYEMNSKVVKASDDMYGTVANIAR
jgi:flagellar basal-body rod protein FlgG